jgi:hypothetical protein
MSDDQAVEAVEVEGVSNAAPGDEENAEKPKRSRKPAKPTREELILAADPSWKPGKPTSHLQAITGPDGSIVKFVHGNEAPGNSLY